MSDPALAPTEVPCPPRSRDAARQAWAQRLERFAQSGLSPAQFCANEGVSLPSFYSWKRRLAAPTDPADASTSASAGPRLLPVLLTPPAATIELVLPTGPVLRLPPGCDLTFVRSLVLALGGTSC